MFISGTQRLTRDFEEIIRTDEIASWGFRVEPVNNDMRDLRGEIEGPPDTPYEGGKFVLEIGIPMSYPFNPPNVRFLTKVWHPNISSATGAIALDILYDEWSPTMTLKTIMMALKALLSAPEPDYPHEPTAARQFKENFDMFQFTARHWSNAYAGGPFKNEEFDDKIKKLMKMGVDEHEARVALSSYNWDLKNATEQRCLVNKYTIANSKFKKK